MHAGLSPTGEVATIIYGLIENRFGNYDKFAAHCEEKGLKIYSKGAFITLKKQKYGGATHIDVEKIENTVKELGYSDIEAFAKTLEAAIRYSHIGTKKMVGIYINSPGTKIESGDNLSQSNGTLIEA